MSARIGIVGTFDLLNFGDLLFPLLAKHALASRLPDLELIPYSYLAKSTPEWPYEVRPLHDLTAEIDSLDLLIVGGGDLVRFDKDVATGYGPSQPGLQHPTAYWLMPTILAAARGVPVAWNAVGVVPGTPAWAEEMLRQALDAADYVAVRDDASAAELSRIGAQERYRVVPDTAFAIRSLLPGEGPSHAFRAFAAAHDLTAPYVIVQATPAFTGEAGTLRHLVGELRADGYKVLEVPIGPALGDRCGLLGLEGVIACERLVEEPLLLAEVVSHADAVVTKSLHLSIAALAQGVPVNRFASQTEPKHRLLEALPGVQMMAGEPGHQRLLTGRTLAAGEALECALQVEAHWDRIAALVGTRSSVGPAVIERLAGAYVESGHSSAVSIDEAGELRVHLARLETQLGARQAHVDNLEAAAEAARRQQTLERHATETHLANLEAAAGAAREQRALELEATQTHIANLEATWASERALLERQLEARQVHIDNIEAMALRARGEVDSLTHELDATRVHATNLEVERDTYYEVTVDLRLHFELSREETSDIAGRLGERDQQVVVLQTQLADAVALGESRLAEVATVNAELAGLTGDLAGLRSELETLEQERLALSATAASQTLELLALRADEARRRSRLASRGAQYLETYGLRASLARALQPWRWRRHPG